MLGPASRCIKFLSLYITVAKNDSYKAKPKSLIKCSGSGGIKAIKFALHSTDPDSHALCISVPIFL